MTKISFSLRFSSLEGAHMAAERLSARGMDVTWALDAEAEFSSSEEVEEVRAYTSARRIADRR